MPNPYQIAEFALILGATGGGDWERNRPHAESKRRFGPIRRFFGFQGAEWLEKLLAIGKLPPWTEKRI